MRNPFDFELRDLWLAITLAIAGFVITLKPFLLLMNKLNPIQGLFIYYIIVFGFLFAISRAGWISFIDRNDIVRNVVQVIGLTLIFFSFFIVFNLTNGYIQYVITGSQAMSTQIFLQAEDGALWYAWNALIQPSGWWTYQLTRILTFVLTPFTLAFIGGLLVKGKADFS